MCWVCDLRKKLIEAEKKKIGAEIEQAIMNMPPQVILIGAIANKLITEKEIAEKLEQEQVKHELYNSMDIDLKKAQ